MVCSGARLLCLEGSGKDYTDILKICYLRCKKIIGSLKVMIDLCQRSYRPKT